LKFLFDPIEILLAFMQALRAFVTPEFHQNIGFRLKFEFIFLILAFLQADVKTFRKNILSTKLLRLLTSAFK